MLVELKCAPSTKQVIFVDSTPRMTFQNYLEDLKGKHGDEWRGILKDIGQTSFDNNVEKAMGEATDRFLALLNLQPKELWEETAFGDRLKEVKAVLTDKALISNASSVAKWANDVAVRIYGSEGEMAVGIADIDGTERIAVVIAPVGYLTPDPSATSDDLSKTTQWALEVACEALSHKVARALAERLQGGIASLTAETDEGFVPYELPKTIRELTESACLSIQQRAREAEEENEWAF